MKKAANQFYVYYRREFSEQYSRIGDTWYKVYEKLRDPMEPILLRALKRILDDQIAENDNDEA